MPMLRMAMYAGGVELYCAPTVDDRDTWQSTMRHIALEGRCFVLTAVQYLTRADCPADYHPIQGDAPDTVLIRGGSAIYGPLGEEIAAPVYGREAVLGAEIDLGRSRARNTTSTPLGTTPGPTSSRSTSTAVQGKACRSTRRKTCEYSPTLD